CAGSGRPPTGRRGLTVICRASLQRSIHILYYKNKFCGRLFFCGDDSGPQTCPCFKIFCIVRIYSCLIFWLEILAYRSLDEIWLCPRKSRMATTSAPCSSKFEAKVCRKLWQLAAIPAALA